MDSDYRSLAIKERIKRKRSRANQDSQRATALRDAHSFKEQFDEEAEHSLFRHLFPADD